MKTNFLFKLLLVAITCVSLYSCTADEIETKPDSLSQVTDILYKNDTVTQIYRVTGRDKLHVHAVASSSDEMEHFLHNVIDALPGVISCSCNTILSRIKDIKGLRL